MADVFTAITENDWSDDERPEIRIEHATANRSMRAALFIGGSEVAEICQGTSTAEVVDSLEGWKDIFTEAEEVARSLLKFN